MASLSNIRTGAAAAEAPLAPAPVAPAPAANPLAAPVTNGVTLIDDRTASVVDSRGRTIKIKKLSALDRMRLFKAVGAEDSENRLFMSYANAAAAVTELEGMSVSPVANQIQLSALVARLDEDGLEAVVNGLVALNPERDDVVTAAKN